MKKAKVAPEIPFLFSHPTYFGPGSDALKQVDRETGEVRDSVLADVERNTRLADALGCDFVMSQALPRDLPAHTLYPGVFAAMVRNTPRPLVVTGITGEDFLHVHALAAKAAAGGREGLERSPRGDGAEVKRAPGPGHGRPPDRAADRGDPGRDGCLPGGHPGRSSPKRKRALERVPFGLIKGSARHRRRWQGARRAHIGNMQPTRDTASGVEGRRGLNQRNWNAL